MRVLFVEHSDTRGELLRKALLGEGYDVVAALSSPLALLESIGRLRPDVIVIDVDSPSRDVLEHLGMVAQHAPRPIVMFSPDGAPDAIRRATRAGVSAYVVDGAHRMRIGTILEAATARFEEFQSLRAQLADANLKLLERKVVEKAKGLLMRRHGLDEDAAYAALRKMAMDRSLKLSEMAQRVIDAANLLGA